MKVSVITVSYNAASTIGDTLASVRAQDYHDVEHIVVDGASTDGTMDVVRGFARAGLRVVSEPDKGLYDAMNKGVALATGDLIGFLNADDFFAQRDALRVLVEAAKASPPAAAVCGAVAIVQPDRPDVVFRYYRSVGFKPWMLRHGHMPPHPGFYVRKSAFEQVGPFDISLKVGADFEWMVRFFNSKHLLMAPIERTVVGLRVGGISTRGLASAQVINEEALRSLRRWGVTTHAVLIWAKYAAKAFQLLRRPHDYPEGAWLPGQIASEPPTESYSNHDGF